MSGSSVSSTPPCAPLPADARQRQKAETWPRGEAPLAEPIRRRCLGAPARRRGHRLASKTPRGAGGRWPPPVAAAGSLAAAGSRAARSSRASRRQSACLRLSERPRSPRPRESPPPRPQQRLAQRRAAPAHPQLQAVPEPSRHWGTRSRCLSCCVLAFARPQLRLPQPRRRHSQRQAEIAAGYGRRRRRSHQTAMTCAAAAVRARRRHYFC